VIFGKMLPGSPDSPAVSMESVHYLLKLVAGAPNLRPAWFFDIRQQGEGLADVGTHLVDLVQWTVFPEQAIDYRKDIQVSAGTHWPTTLTLADFQRVTGEKQFPEYLKDAARNGSLDYYCNNSVTYSIRGVFVKLDVKWGFEAAAGVGDTELAVFRGGKSRVEVRQGREEHYRPEVYVVPNTYGMKAGVAAALKSKLAKLASGLELEDRGERLHIIIPERLRIGHEAHFALLVSRFLGLVKDPASLPTWENSCMSAKYYVTTKGVELARREKKP
jgi:hypothetical protein